MLILNMRLSIHGAWWPRNEGLDDSVDRVNESLIQLGQLSPHWNSWFFERPLVSLVGESEPAAVGDLDLIHAKLLSSQEPTEEGPANKELGYSINLLSNPSGSALDERSQFNLACCSQTQYSGYNSIRIRLPAANVAPKLYHSDLLIRAVAAISKVWDPDWLIALDLLNRLTPEPWRPGPVLGWVNYLPPRTGIVVGDLPAGWQWFEGLGEKQIFVHESGRPDPKNQQHILAFREMYNRIRWKEPPIGLKRG